MNSKLYFYHAPMNSGKSMLLLAKAYSFTERNIPFLIFKSTLDTRDEGVIHSRSLGDRECITIAPNETFSSKFDFYNSEIKWILVDESQFLTKEQVDELSDIVDYAGINVMCYGLRTDFQTNLFEGSKRLFEIADTIEEIKSTCQCGDKKTIFNARIDKEGNVMLEGEQIEVGGEDKYITLCRKCFKERTKNKESKKK